MSHSARTTADHLPKPMKWAHSETSKERQRHAERQLLAELAALRRPLLADVERRQGRRGRKPAAAEHRCCQRPENQMRISPLEARAIAAALRENPSLRAKLPEILARLAGELPRLRDNSERQSFDCPLLEEGRCLVHKVAKPIGCLAWNDGESYTQRAWKAFARRDELNDQLYGRQWQYRVIPLWLKRVLKAELTRWRRRQERSDEAPVRVRRRRGGPRRRR